MSSTTPDAAGNTEAAEAAREAWLLARSRGNAEILTFYAASLSALIAVFIVAHWVRVSAGRFHWSQPGNVVSRPFIALTRIARRIFVRKLPGFTSAGHAILVTIYVALNLLFSFYRTDLSKPTDLAARFGWMAAGNMVLVVFLALKNTPFAILTAYSYERLNALHQISGYTTLVYAICHGCVYSAYFINEGRVDVLRKEIVTAAIILGFSIFSTVLAGMILRRLNYELFYIIHVVLFLVIVVALGLHRPSFDEDRVLYATVLIGALWFSDRLIRVSRLIYNSVNNEATVYALPEQGTRIVLKKPLLRARPGKHCYVWIPKIRAFETHPFTIVSSNPMELVINTHSGFTRDLHKHAAQNPGASLKVSVEGPYGTLPNTMDFDKVVLVAGGSGATFTFGIAADMLQRMTENSKQQIDFIWAVRGHDNLLWFSNHLSHLRNHVHAPKIALKVHLTKPIPNTPLADLTLAARRRTASVASKDSSPMLPPLDLEKGAKLTALSIPSSSIGPRDDSDVDEKRAISHSDTPPSGMTSAADLPIIHGRPDTESEIRAAVRSLSNDKRVLIAACGPDSLLTIVRNTAASCITVGGPAVEVHCEQFGW
ncbi:ferric reductase NAD binding domain-containing protein [Xylariaceae sp. FL0662B]|nr:ferric reductase NAD binding domain-containing protein [Xylariaceae sp. FL0662B]